MDDFDLSVVFCVPVNPEEYDPERKRIWDGGIAEVVAQGNAIPSVYPGSIFEPCAECGIRVAVGPRQQAAMQEHEATIMCMICAVMKVGEESDTKGVKVTAVNLGNPFIKKT
jgi:hypothetical protein